MIPKLKLRNWFLIFLGLVMTLFFLGLRFSDIGRSQPIDQELHASMGFDPLGVYPPRDANKAALQLELLAAKIGIELAPKDDKKRAHPSEEAASTLADVAGDIRDHLQSLLTPSPALTAPSEEVAAWLSNSLVVLDQVAALLEGEEPKWELHLEDGFGSRIPNLLGHLQLHRGLLLAAAESARLGAAPDEIERWLAAVHILERSIEEDPILIHRLIAMAEHGQFLTLLRTLTPPPRGWRDFLNPRPWRAMAHESLRLEGWLVGHSLQDGSLEKSMLPRKTPRWLARILAQAGTRQYLETMEHAVQRLEQEDPRQFDTAQFFDEEYKRISRWNLFARWMFPNFFDASIKAAKHELDIDLTEQVLALRTLIAACETEPIEIPFETPSAIEEIRWHYSMEAERIVIQASDSLPGKSKSSLPLEFQIPIPPECSTSVRFRTGRVAIGASDQAPRKASRSVWWRLSEEPGNAPLKGSWHLPC